MSARVALAAHRDDPNGANGRGEFFRRATRDTVGEVEGGTLPEVAVLAVASLVPGVGLSFLVIEPGRRSALAIVATALPFGFAVVMISGVVMASVGALSPQAGGSSWVFLSVAVWVAAVRGGRLIGHVREMESEIASAPLLWIVGLCVAVGFVAIRASVPSEANLAPTPLRYWADGLEIADARGSLEGVLHWGTQVAPTVSKVGLNVVHAQVSFLVGRDPMETLGPLLLLGSVALGLAVLAFGRELGLARMSGVLAILLVASPLRDLLTFAGDLDAARAENWGRLLGVTAVLLVTRALRGSGRAAIREGSAGAVLLAAAAVTHPVAAAAAALLIGWLAIGRAVARPRLGEGPDRVRERPVLTALVVSAGATALWIAVLVAASGELGFQGMAGDLAYDEIARERVGGVDPVLYLVTDGHPERYPTFDGGPGGVFTSLAAQLLGRGPARTADAPLVILFIPTIVVGVAVALCLRCGDRERRALAIALAGFLATLMAIAVGFSVRYDTFALANFGSRRLFTYLVSGGVVLAAAGAETLLAALRPRVATTVATVATVVAAAILMPLAGATPPKGARDDLAALRWVGSHVPCEGRVLADRRTLAAFEAISGRAGVLEGMGPHVRPALLDVAVREMLDAQAFFEDPAAGADYLRDHGVAAIVTTGPGRTPRLGGWLPLVEAPPVGEAPGVTAAFRAGDVTVFTVDEWTPNPILPTISGRPGFGC